MPTNLYGPGDNYDLTSSHVLPALIRKCHEARLNGATELALWGSGSPRREFLHSDDMAEACVFLMDLPEEAFGAHRGREVPAFRSSTSAPERTRPSRNWPA